MVPPPLYADLVGGQDALELLASSPRRIADLVGGFDARRWSGTYAPGKWTAAQIVLHLGQGEISFGNRIRFALTVDDYVLQPYDGARWVDLESPAEPETALGAYLALRRQNLRLYGRLTPEQRARPISHPERGAISVEWILQTLAGHDLHHLAQLRAVAPPIRVT